MKAVMEERKGKNGDGCESGKLRKGRAERALSTREQDVLQNISGLFCLLTRCRG